MACDRFSVDTALRRAGDLAFHCRPARLGLIHEQFRQSVIAPSITQRPSMMERLNSPSHLALQVHDMGRDADLILKAFCVTDIGDLVALDRDRRGPGLLRIDRVNLAVDQRPV
jgi:hypothetical protein